MKNTILTLMILLGFNVIVNAQFAVYDSSQDLNMIESLKKASDQLKQLKEQAKILDEQTKFARDIVKTIDDGLQTMSVVAEITQNSTGVYDDYQVALNNFSELKKGKTKEINNYIDQQTTNMLSIVTKSGGFNSDIKKLLKNDFLSMNTADRMTILNNINDKIVSLRLVIRDMISKTKRKISQQAMVDSIYSVPALK